MAILRRLLPASTLIADGPWLRVNMERLPGSQRSGWKLHVSAAPDRYAALLEIALPLLGASPYAFKIAASIDVVEDLCDGRYGLTQAGKAMTIYPADEAGADALAGELSRRLRGWPGPAIPGDTRYAPDAPVYYRFGPFDGRFEIDALGARRRIVWRPDLGEVRDTTDGGTVPPPAPERLPAAAPADHLAFLRDRFLPVRVLHLSAKGGAFLAVRRSGPSPADAPLFLKSARKGAQADRFGRDALWGLRREHALLSALAPREGTPPPGELLEDPAGEAGAIVRPFLEGATFWELWSAPGARTPEGKRTLARLLSQAADIAAGMHAQGIVVRDLSPENLLAAEHGAVLLDLELAHRLEDDAPPFRRGTPGFHDPARSRFARPRIADDHYALLALALMAHTGLHPVLTGDALLEAFAGEDHAAAPFARRWSDAAAALGGPEFLPAYQSLLEAIPDRDVPLRARARAHPDPDFAGLLASALDRAGKDRNNPECFNVYDGLPGMVLAALELDPDSLLTPDILDRLHALFPAWRDAARALSRIPGLYFGVSGVGLAGVALGVWAGRAEWHDAGAALLCEPDPRAYPVPDVCQGLAGRVHAQLAAYRVTGDPRFADAAVDGGRALGAAAVPSEEGGLCWPWPEGPEYAGLAGARHYGFAHGAAGAVHALLALVEAVDDAAPRDTAGEGLQTLLTAARPAPGPGHALWWPVSRDDGSVWNAWCHGTPGVVKALVRAAAVFPDKVSPDYLAAALRGIAAANNGGYCLCHGIASRVDAYADAAALCPGLAAQGIASDAALLRAARFEALHAASPPGARAEGHGLMTGPAGVWRSIAKAEGAFRGPFGPLLP